MQKLAFGADAVVEDMVAGTEFGNIPGCFLFRVKDACAAKTDFRNWPDLIEEAMRHVVETRGCEDAIMIKSRGLRPGVPRSRIYDSIQITSRSCICRVPFGDAHQKRW